MIIPGFKQLISGLWIWILLAVPAIAYSQATTQNQPPAPAKPKVVYSQNMTTASRELNWSQTYFLSFKKTREAIYLKLAASHCGNAINVLKATQASFPNTTRFYYIAKNKRFDACRFFKKLQDTSLRLDPTHHIQDLPNDGCDF